MSKNVPGSMAEIKTSWSHVLALRLEKSFLTSPSTSMEAAAERLIGVQAQVMSSAEAALCLRVKGATPTKVQNALWKKRTLVKTWTQRGTLHLVTPSDLELFVAAMQARGDYWTKPAWERYHGVTRKEMAIILAGISEALGDDRLTREELAARLGDTTGKHAVAKKIMSSWGATIKPAAFQGKLCFGPNRGRNITFVSPSAWIGELKVPEGDEALERLAVRYLETYGPATRDELTRWLGVESKIGNRAWKLCEDQRVSLVVDGSERWTTPRLARELKKERKSGVVRLLPAFDPYIVGVLKGLEHVVPKPTLRDQVSRKAGWISATIVHDGRIIGTWRHVRRPKGKGVDITLEPFATIKPALRKLIDEEVDRMSSLMSAIPDEDSATDVTAS